MSAHAAFSTCDGCRYWALVRGRPHGAGGGTVHMPLRARPPDSSAGRARRSETVTPRVASRQYKFWQQYKTEAGLLGDVRQSPVFYQ